MGLIGTVRASGGAVGNAILATVLNDRFEAYVGPEIAAIALQNDLNPQELPQIIPAAILYNIHSPSGLENISGMTPSVQEALRVGVRTAYGHAYKIVFYITISFSVIALISSLFVRDATKYMTNHTQFVMSKNLTTHKRPHNFPGDECKTEGIHIENTAKSVKETAQGAG